MVLAAAVEPEEICAKYTNKYVPPPAAVAAAKECNGCNRELAERFANADGVERNFEIAEYFLCRAQEEMGPMEFENMFAHVQRMRSGEDTDPLDFCDYVSSGYGETYCANARYDKVMPRLKMRLDALRAKVTAGEQFDAVRKRGEAYADVESQRIGEQARGGSGYVAVSTSAEVDQKERFVVNLERWSNARAAGASIAETRRADNNLNAAYRAAQKKIDKTGEDEIANWKSFLRDAQRAWIAYRDAFAIYYVARWRGEASPAMLRREIVTHLTRERTAELRGEQQPALHEALQENQ